MLVSFVAIGTYSQTTERSEESDKTTPAQFKTAEMQLIEEVNVMSQSPICNFMQNQLEVPEVSATLEQEGEVVVQFTIEENGELSDIEVINSVSPDLDQAVIDCLQKTNGQWEAALLDGRAVETERKLHVIFDMEGNTPHLEMAGKLLQEGIETFNQASALNENSYSEEKLMRKSDRLYNRALYFFDEAGKYKAEQASVSFWEAKTYGAMGDMSMRQEKLDEYLHLISPDETVNSDYVSINLSGKK